MSVCVRERDKSVSVCVCKRERAARQEKEEGQGGDAPVLVGRILRSCRERVLYWQPTGPNPLYHCDGQLDRPRAMGVSILFSDSLTSIFLYRSCRDRIFIDLMTLTCKLEAPREGSK